MKKFFAFAYLDGMEWMDYMKEFGVSTIDLPCAVVMNERVGWRNGLAIDRMQGNELTNRMESIINVWRLIEKCCCLTWQASFNVTPCNFFVMDIDTRAPVTSSSLRYYFSVFIHSFNRLPRISRVFLSISFTFALAVITLRVIFFFTQPERDQKQHTQPSTQSPKPNGHRKPVRRHIISG